jgi:predicted amidohydrolase
MVCWDLQYPEPARALARAGAEIILLPIWGGNEILAQARAIENHVFLVTSSYDITTRIIDPMGRVLAEATAENPVAAASVDLAAPIVQMPWLGDMKSRTWSERRTDLG